MSEDQPETTDRNPQSYIAWKRLAEKRFIALSTIRNITDGHPIDANRRDRIFQLATEALKE